MQKWLVMKDMDRKHNDWPNVGTTFRTLASIGSPLGHQTVFVFLELVSLFKLRYNAGFWLVEMDISTNPKPAIYHNLYRTQDLYPACIDVLLLDSLQTTYIAPMLVHCWASVVYGGPALFNNWLMSHVWWELKTMATSLIRSRNRWSNSYFLRCCCPDKYRNLKKHVAITLGQRFHVGPSLKQSFS